MSMDVEQTGDDELAARVDGVCRVTRNGGLDRGDAASRDGHVAHRIEPNGRVDHPPALDDHVVFCCECSPISDEHGRACGCGCGKKLAPVQHCDLPSSRIAEMLAVSNLCVNTIAHSTTNREKLSIPSATSAGQNFRTLLSCVRIL